MSPAPALPEVRVPSLVVILPALENSRLLQGVALNRWVVYFNVMIARSSRQPYFPLEGRPGKYWLLNLTEYACEFSTR